MAATPSMLRHKMLRLLLLMIGPWGCVSPPPAADQGQEQGQTSDARIIPPGSRACTAEPDCDDHLACTTDSCSGWICINAIAPEYCVIGKACVQHGDVDGINFCRACRPTLNQSAWTEVCRVTTLAGSGVEGFVDGPALTARFGEPSGVAVDGQGTVYVADRTNSAIRMIADGQVSTLAGDGTAGFLDGPAAQARFDHPEGLCLDSLGDLYIVDTGNYRLRKISGGQVTTVAGNGQPGFADGPALQAMLAGLSSCAVDDQGRIIADSEGRIRLVHEGQVTTVAGTGQHGFADGPAESAKFSYISGIAVHAADNVFIADYGNNRIRLLSGGTVSTLAGKSAHGYVDGPAAEAVFQGPLSIACDGQGRVLVTDGDRVRLVTDDQVSTLAGRQGIDFADGLASEAAFWGAYGLAVDATGNIYVADGENRRIRIIEVFR